MKVEIEIRQSLYEKIKMLCTLLDEDVKSFIENNSNDGLEGILDTLKKDFF